MCEQKLKVIPIIENEDMLIYPLIGVVNLLNSYHLKYDKTLFKKFTKRFILQEESSHFNK